MGGRASSGTSGRAPVFTDVRGSLTVVPYDELPFAPARVYVLTDVPQGARRGGHACRTQHRFLLGLAGTAAVTLDDGRATDRLELRLGDTLHIPPRMWFEIEAATSGVCILVLADGPYDPDDYA